MDGVRQRLEAADKALGTLESALPRAQEDDLARDGIIQRFEYTFEAVWKAARALLVQVEGVDVVGPKSVIRVSREAGLLSDEDTARALEMTDDRNRTRHTYHEEFAQALAGRIPTHARVLRVWLNACMARA